VSFLKEAAKHSKVKSIAAICHGPWLLAEAELIEEKAITSYPSIKTDMINAGGKWTDSEVVVDGKLITSRNPNDLPKFVDAIANSLSH
jgi:protease I